MKHDMKKVLRTLTAAAAIATMTAACVSEATEWNKGHETDGQGNGYISFATGGLIVDDRNETVGSNPSTSAATRAGNTDTDTYTVEIYNTADDAQPAAAFVYGERGNAPIELPTGTYYIKVFSDTTPATAWEGDPATPTYGAYVDKYTNAEGKETAIEITKNHTADNPLRIGKITCRLQTVKATVSLHEAMKALTSGTSVDLVLGGVNSLEFTESEIGTVRKNGSTTEQVTPAKACYLKPVEGKKNPLVLYLTTTFEGKAITRQPMSISPDAKAGEFRKITLNLDNADNGSLIITAQIETWVYDEKVDVDVATLAVLSESKIPDEDDPDAPKLELSGASIDDVFALNESMFDENGDCTSPCSFTLTAKAPLAKFTVEVESTNTAFAEYIAANSLDTPVDICGSESGPAKAALRSWGFPTTNIAGQTSRTFSLKNLMSTLYPAYEGEHTFNMVLTDGDGRKTEYAFRVAVDLAAASDPDIRWIGEDIDTRHDTYAGMEIKIRVKASKGIASLKVKISGALDLSDVQMPNEFDLVDPDASKEGLSATLGKDGFGFPVCDEVRNQTELEFEISQFVPLMSSFKGDTDFELTVVDNEGETITKAVKLRVN